MSKISEKEIQFREVIKKLRNDERKNLKDYLCHRPVIYCKTANCSNETINLCNIINKKFRRNDNEKNDGR